MQSTVRFTITDLESFPDTLDDTRYEIIDGELFVAHQPHWYHQETTLLVSAALLAWSVRTGLGRPNPAPGLIFSDEDNVAPDILWISNERLKQGLGEDGKLHVAPELVIEVLSPGSDNVRRDREAKLKLYGIRGVDEYWIIDWRARRLEVFRRGDNALSLAATLSDGDTLVSPVLPGFDFPVSSFWTFPQG